MSASKKKYPRSHAIFRLPKVLEERLTDHQRHTNTKSLNQVVVTLLAPRLESRAKPQILHAPPSKARHFDLFTSTAMGESLKAMSAEAETTIGTMIYNLLLEELDAVTTTKEATAGHASSRLGVTPSFATA